MLPMEMIFIGIVAVFFIAAIFGGSIYVANKFKSTLEAPKSEDKGMLMLQGQLAKLTERMDERLDKSSEQMRSVMYQQFRESSKLIAEVTESLVKLQKGNE